MAGALKAEIIAVGSELLLGGKVETNSAFLAQRLAEVGARVRRKWVVADDRDDIRHALLEAVKDSSDIILLTGGLGPTNDDLTREALADGLGRKLATNEALIRRLEQLYDRFGVTMTANNRRQAQVPEGAMVLENPNGTAPGLFLEERGSLIFALPGPPRELEPMVRGKVLDLIRERRSAPEGRQRCLKVIGLPESAVDDKLEGIYQRFEDVETTILSSGGIISVHFTWRGPDDANLANQTLSGLAGQARKALGRAVYAQREVEFEEVLGNLLRERAATLATAESCSGGLMGKLLTDIPGSSDYYLGGFVTYSNRLKTELLGVNETTLERFGAVSQQVAEQMAQGARERSGADYALSITGVAGPEGGSEAKPVGLVHVGLAGGSGIVSRPLQLPGDRAFIRLRSARLALDLLRRKLLGEACE